MNTRLITLLLISFLSFAASDSEALEVPQKPESHVNDYASILSGESKSAIEETLADFEAKTANQVVVATFEGLEGQGIEDFSIRLAQKWKIGAKTKDNGVIVLVFKNDRQVRIETGYGLEGVLTDALCDTIIRNEIAPYFRKGDYDSGVVNGVNAIIKAASGDYKPGGRHPQDTLDLFIGLAMPAIFFLIMILTFYAEYHSRKNRYWGASSRGDYHGGWGSSYGGDFGGGGGFGGGGFGGGGGSFGGGGASGRW